MAQTVRHQGGRPKKTENDPDLARLLDLWSELPEARRTLLRATAEMLVGQQKA